MCLPNEVIVETLPTNLPLPQDQSKFWFTDSALWPTSSWPSPSDAYPVNVLLTSCSFETFYNQFHMSLLLPRLLPQQPCLKPQDPKLKKKKTITSHHVFQDYCAKKKKSLRVVRLDMEQTHRMWPEQGRVAPRERTGSVRLRDWVWQAWSWQVWAWQWRRQRCEGSWGGG